MQEVKTAQTSPSGVRRPSTGIGRPMTISRRGFIQAATAVAAVAPRASSAQPAGQSGAYSSPPAVARLQPLPGQAVPITDDERRARIEKARRLMSEHGMSAIVLEPGTSMRYFVDVAWGTSERPFLLVIPAKGELAYIAPGIRRGTCARDHQVHRRRAGVAGGRGLGCHWWRASSGTAAWRLATSGSRSASVSSSQTDCAPPRRRAGSCWRRPSPRAVA